MKTTISITLRTGKLGIHLNEFELDDTNQEDRILIEIFSRHMKQIRDEIFEALSRADQEQEKQSAATTESTWHPSEIRTDIKNPRTGEEYILSDYYVNEDGDTHFTHDEALAIAEHTPGWRLCDNEFHMALCNAVWDKEKDDWRENVNGSGLNGYEYMTQKLEYELGGFRTIGNGTLYSVGSNGFSWSSSVSGTSAYYLDFNYSGINPNNTTGRRAYGFQVRLIKTN